MAEVGFSHGCLADSYEEQANAQGYTFGDKAEYVEKVGYYLKFCWVQGCFSDKEYDKILQRFQKKIIVPNLKRTEVKE